MPWKENSKTAPFAKFAKSAVPGIARGSAADIGVLSEQGLTRSFHLTSGFVAYKLRMDALGIGKPCELLIRDLRPGDLRVRVPPRPPFYGSSVYY